jgi:AcrR family transcriptional regulator
VATAARLTRGERAALTRRELLSAAERRFFRDGYHGTTLDDIADEAGYTKGAVYSTFKSKGGLFMAMFELIVERRVEELRLLLAPHEGDEAKLAALAEVRVDEHASQFLLLTIEFWVHAAREPALLEEFSERYRRMRSKLSEMAPEHRSFDAQRWATVTLALSNVLALERLIDPAGVPGDLMASVQRRLLEQPPSPEPNTGG